MKKLLSIVLLLFTLSCKKEEPAPVKPMADFSWSETGNGDVVFVNRSHNWTTAQWLLGDGSISLTPTQVTHHYTSNGQYKVILSVKDNSGNEDLVSNTIKVISAPTRGDFMFYTSANIGDNITVAVGQGSGAMVGTITKYQSSGSPSSCGIEGFFTVNLPEGFYSYAAKSGKYSWSGNFTVVNGICRKLELTL